MRGNCTRCGRELAKSARFCRKCGAPVVDPDAATENLTLLRETDRIQPKNPTREKPRRTKWIPKDEPDDVTPAASEAADDLSPDADALPAAAPSIVLAPAVSSVRRRNWLALAIPGLLVVVAAGSFFLFNFNPSSAEPSADNRPPANAPSASPAAAPAAAPSKKAPDQPVAVAEKPTPAAVKPTPAPAVLASVQERPAPVANSPAPAPPAYANSVAPTPTPAATPASRVVTAADYYNQGVAHLNAGRYSDALQEFDKVRRLAPGNADVYYLIGQCHHRLGQLEKALAAYRLCTLGVYASVAQSHVKNLEQTLGK
jgi:Tetratricopeptide repeat/zinc-ribbon domain